MRQCSMVKQIQPISNLTLSRPIVDDHLGAIWLATPPAMVIPHVR